MNILNQLESTGVPFAILKAFVTMKGITDEHQSDWCVIAPVSCYNQIKQFGFSSPEYATRNGKPILRGKKHDLVVEKDLTKYDIADFRANISRFEKVQDDENGVIYELKYKSLRAYFKKYIS